MTVCHFLHGLKCLNPFTISDLSIGWSCCPAGKQSLSPSVGPNGLLVQFFRIFRAACINCHRFVEHARMGGFATKAHVERRVATVQTEAEWKATGPAGRVVERGTTPPPIWASRHPSVSGVASGGASDEREAVALNFGDAPTDGDSPSAADNTTSNVLPKSSEGNPLSWSTTATCDSDHDDSECGSASPPRVSPAPNPAPHDGPNPINFGTIDVAQAWNRGKRVGRGAFSEARLCLAQVGLGFFFVAKRIKVTADTAEEPKEMELAGTRELRELCILQGLCHPNIIKLFGHKLIRDEATKVIHLFICMEYMAGAPSSRSAGGDAFKIF